MNFRYEQGYHGGGQAPMGGPFGAGIPPGGVSYQGGQYGGTATPSAPPGPYDSSTPAGYAPYGGNPPPPGGQYAEGQVPGTPYGGYGQPQGGPYGQQAPAGNIPPGVNPEAYQWFQSVDIDNNGFITLKELKQALLNSNWSAFNEETCLMMINMFDQTRSGRMDVFGFSALWVFMQQWRSLFQQFDHDGSGCISGTELHQALSQMGYNLSPQFTQSLASRYSLRGTQGSMQLDRFIQVCTQLQSMTQAFREKDTAMTGNVRMSYEDFLTGAIMRLV